MATDLVPEVARPVAEVPRRAAAPKRRLFGRGLWRYRWLYLLLLPGLAYFVVFKYLPMYGLTIAFKDYVPFLGYSGSEWVGLKHFQELFTILERLDPANKDKFIHVDFGHYRFPEGKMSPRCLSAAPSSASSRWTPSCSRARAAPSSRAAGRRPRCRSGPRRRSSTPRTSSATSTATTL